jgi:FkbM family methyltransferase
MKKVILTNPLKSKKLFKKQARALSKEYKYLFLNATKDEVFFQKKKRKMFGSLLVPDGDSHFPKAHDRYQYATFLLATIYLKEKRVAVDVGAHVGFMSRAMSEIFNTTISIEPDQRNYQCLQLNCPKVLHINEAVGTGKETGSIVSHIENTGMNYFEEGSDGMQTCRIDDLIEETDQVDLIKFDIQGFEYKALLGAAKTIEKWMPILIVEVSMGNGEFHDIEEIRELLFNLGYVEELKFGKDCLYVPKGKSLRI